MAKSNFELTLISSGVKELLHEVGETACKEQAQQIAGRCGSGYGYETKRMGTRTIASVYTDTPDAMADNQAHNTLAKAIR